MAYKVSQSADLNLFRGVASIRHSLACFNDDVVSVNIGRVCYKKVPIKCCMICMCVRYQ